MKVIDTWRGEDGTKYGLVAEGNEAFVAIDVDSVWQRVPEEAAPARSKRSS